MKSLLPVGKNQRAWVPFGSKSRLGESFFVPLVALATTLSGDAFVGRVKATEPSSVKQEHRSVHTVLTDRAFKQLPNKDHLRPEDITLERAKALTPVVTELTTALKETPNVDSDAFLDALELCADKLNLNPKLAQHKEGKAYALAVLELTDTLLDSMKTGQVNDTNKEGQLRTARLVWCMGTQHRSPEVQKRAAEIFEKHYVRYDRLYQPTGLLVDLAKSPYGREALPVMIEQMKLQWLPMLKKALADVPTQSLESPLAGRSERVITYRQLNEVLKVLRHVYVSEMSSVSPEDLRTLQAELNKAVLIPYATLVRRQLMTSGDFEERQALGQALAAGVALEGSQKALATIQRKWLTMQDAIMYPPRLDSPKRYGDVGPFTALLLDLDRVVFVGSRDVYRYHREKPYEPMTQKSLKEQNRFHRNAVSAYLVAARSLSGGRPVVSKRPASNPATGYVLNDDQYLVGMMMYRFRRSMEQDVYRKLLPPDPAMWGEHATLFYLVHGGRPEEMDVFAHYKAKKRILESVFLTGHTTTSFITNEKLQQEPMFDLYRWRMQYVMLKEKGVADPHKQKDAAQRWINKPEFQEELVKRVQAGFEKFRTALTDATDGNNGLVLGLSSDLGRGRDFSQPLMKKGNEQ